MDWFLLARLQGCSWDERRTVMASSLIRQVAQLWHRVVWYYQLYPWCLSAIIDERVGDDERSPIVNAFTKALPCCIGLSLLPLQNMCKHGLQRSGLSKVLSVSFRRARSQTIAVEERFSRSRVFAATNSGNPPALSTICSNHMLSEAGSFHNQIAERVGAVVPPGASNSSTRVPARRLTGWNLFLQEQGIPVNRSNEDAGRT